MRLYFIRHGQTEANFNKTHSGWGDVMLTEVGKEQARNIGRVLEKIPFDKIYSSDLSRARDTKELVLPGKEFELCPTIREINVGFLARRPVDDCIAEYGEDYLKNKKEVNYKPYGGESYEEFCTRIREFLDMIEKSPYERVAAFCHGGFIYCMLDIITGIFNNRKAIACDNCGVTVIENNGDGWRLITWNYTGEI